MSVTGRRELTAAGSGARLDAYLAEQVENLSRTHARRLIDEGRVRVDGRVVRASHRLQAGEQVSVEVPPPRPIELAAEPMPLRVLYEDADMAIIDKPAGIAVHPAPGHREHTLVNALLARFPDLPGIRGSQRPGIVHRLDLDTSGLLMVAKSDRGQLSLSEQLADRHVGKGYLALVAGGPTGRDGTIEAPIGRDPAHRQRQAIVTDGRPARTDYIELGHLGNRTLMLALPLTGRMHQIRVHFAATGRPIVGDSLYGGEPLLPRQFLHAALLRFRRPSDGALTECVSPLPAELWAVLRQLMADSGVTLAAIDGLIERMLALAHQVFQRRYGNLSPERRGQSGGAPPRSRL